MTPSQTYKQRRKQTIKFLTQDETRRLFKVIKKLRDRAIFLTAYRHGLRASEVPLLQRSDLDLKAGRITIQRLKGSLSGVYPLQPDLLKLLRRYLRSREDSPLPCLSPIGSPRSTAQPSGGSCRNTELPHCSQPRSASFIPCATRSRLTFSTLVQTSPLFATGWDTATSKTLWSTRS